MSTPRNVAVIVGSLRKESFNRKMAKAMIGLAPPSLKLEIIEIGQSHCATNAFGGKRVCDRMAGAEPDDTDPKRAECALLLVGDQVPVAVQAHGAKSSRTQYGDHHAPPGIVGPSSCLAQ